MQTIDLYRSYLAQTAVLNVLNKHDLKISTDSFEIHPVSKVDVEKLVTGIQKHKSFHYEDFREVTGSYMSGLGIHIFLDVWHGVEDVKERVDALKNLLADLPGHKGVCSEDDGDRLVVGAVHGVSYWIRVGKLSGTAKRLGARS